MHTDYFAHDKYYQQRRAEGLPGWNKTEEPYDDRKREIAKLRALGNMPPSGRLLELGCGAGNIAVWLAKQGYEVTGIDISPTAIGWARQRSDDEKADARFIVGDVLELKDFDNDSFDLVLDDHCLHCIIGDDRKRFLSEAYRVLKQGGYFLVETMCGPVDAAAIEGYDPTSRCTLRGQWATRYFGLPDEIEAELQAAGFRILASRIERDTTNGTITVEASK
jgi:ubiquinone/menaquinone biosynthesis C-methylase UbiE